MENGDVSLMVPIRDGCVGKFKSSGILSDLKTPRWSGQERFHLVSPGAIHLLALNFTWAEFSVPQTV